MTILYLKKTSIYCFIAAITAVALTACSNFQSIEHRASNAPASGTAASTATSSSVAPSAALTKLQAAYLQYKGTPYLYGGTDRSGFDCSGFINVVFDEQFDVSLPRTTDGISSRGRSVRRDQLRTGDIILFKTSVKQLHAGIYTEDGKFIHASTSKGVIESSLGNSYWQQRYIGARRYL